MKSRMITTIGIVTAILMTVSGADLAFARGGGGGGSSKGNCTGVNAGTGMSQGGNTHQYQYKQQNQFQYRQNKGASNAQPGNETIQGDPVQLRTRTQLRDPATHEIGAIE